MRLSEKLTKPGRSGELLHMTPPRNFLPAILLSAAVVSLPAEEAPKWPVLTPATVSAPLPGTTLLTDPGDLSLALHHANDRFLDAEIERAKADRGKFWNRDFSSPEAYAKSVAPNREGLVKMLGLDRETRPAPEGGNRFLYVSTDPLTKADTPSAVTWQAFGDVHGDGVVFLPAGGIKADVVLLPDAENQDSVFPAAASLARSGCRVLVVGLVDRGENEHQLSRREWVQRSAFLLGRTMTGYEVLKIQSAIDCLVSSREGFRPIGIIGHGEGGRLALFAAAIDPRIDTVAVSGAFGPREQLWKEPADRNVFGLLREFGDAELASLTTPRSLLIECGAYPKYGYRASGDLELDFENRGKLPGKPGMLPTPSTEDVIAELNRLSTLAPNSRTELVISPEALSSETISLFLTNLGLTAADPIPTQSDVVFPSSPDRTNELVRHNQLALSDAAADRTRYFADLETDTLENFEKTIEPYREKFRTGVIGDFERPLLPPNARTRPYQVGDKTVSYEVVLDVTESGGETVFAYGILTLPKDIDLTSGEKRPVVVCQHGLEGTPQDVIGEAKYDAYKAYATRLAERGFITFAPQNSYKYFDLFRMQQFKAQSIGKTLFSIIVPQHRQITDWLAEQPWVDGEKIAFYGLSYGGKSAMRIPPLVDRYCLSICSADFNEWVWKNAATDTASLRYSYANKGEYEIFEWNLGGTFNYAEMAALICPRPFMVERGHFDGVGPDEQVAFEFAKVRNLYAARLGLADRCEIEWFAGPHSIHAVGTYDFLHRHLGWPVPEK